MLNVKQKTCKYLLFKPYDPTRRRNRIQFYGLRGERSNQYITRCRLGLDELRVSGIVKRRETLTFTYCYLTEPESHK